MSYEADPRKSAPSSSASRYARMTLAAAFLLLGSACGTPMQIACAPITPPPSPPAWTMEAALKWPTLPPSQQKPAIDSKSTQPD